MADTSASGRYFSAVAPLITDPAESLPPGVRERGFAVTPDLATLLIWNVVVASVVHLTTHILGDTLISAFRRNRARLARGASVIHCCCLTLISF